MLLVIVIILDNFSRLLWITAAFGQGSFFFKLYLTLA